MLDVKEELVTDFDADDYQRGQFLARLLREQTSNLNICTVCQRSPDWARRIPLTTLQWAKSRADHLESDEHNREVYKTRLLESAEQRTKRQTEEKLPTREAEERANLLAKEALAKQRAEELSKRRAEEARSLRESEELTKRISEELAERHAQEVLSKRLANEKLSRRTALLESIDAARKQFELANNSLVEAMQFEKHLTELLVDAERDLIIASKVHEEMLGTWLSLRILQRRASKTFGEYPMCSRSERKEVSRKILDAESVGRTHFMICELLGERLQTLSKILQDVKAEIACRELDTESALRAWKNARSTMEIAE